MAEAPVALDNKRRYGIRRETLEAEGEFGDRWTRIDTKPEDWPEMPENRGRKGPWIKAWREFGSTLYNKLLDQRYRVASSGETIVLGVEGKRHMLGQRQTLEGIKSIPHLPEIIQKAFKTGGYNPKPSQTKNPDKRPATIYHSAAVIDGKPYDVTLVAKHNAEGEQELMFYDMRARAKATDGPIEPGLPKGNDPHRPPQIGSPSVATNIGEAVPNVNAGNTGADLSTTRVADFFSDVKDIVDDVAPGEGTGSGKAGDGSAKLPADSFDPLKNVDVITQRARESRDYARQQMDLHALVEAAGIKQLSPAHMQSALEFAGPAMREQVALPADAALELYRIGTDVLTPLGITEEQAQKAAAQGQGFMAPISRMHAYLDKPQFEAAADILRRTPEAVSAAEAARIDERAAADAAKAMEPFQPQAFEPEALGKEKERLRAEAEALDQSATPVDTEQADMRKIPLDAQAVRDNDGTGNPLRRKFEAAKTAKVNGKEMGEIPKFTKMKELVRFVASWAAKQKVFYREDYINNDTGWNNIALRAKGVEDTLQHSAGIEKIQTIPALPELIRNGVYLDSQPAHNKKQQGMTSHFFAAKIDIAEKPMVVGFVIKEDANGKRFYDHELTTVKSLDAPQSGATANTEKLTEAKERQGDVINIVRKHLNVKPAGPREVVDPPKQSEIP